MSIRCALIVLVGWIGWADHVCARDEKTSSPAATTYTRADFALDLCQRYKYHRTDDPKTLYGQFNTTILGGWDGQQPLSYYDQPLTLEVLAVTLVRLSGWDVVHYSASVADSVRPYVSPQGFPYAGPHAGPRSIPFVVVGLEKGLLREPDLKGLREPLDRKQTLAVLDRYDGLLEKEKQGRADDVPPLKMLPSGFNPETAHGPLADHPAQLLVVPRNGAKGFLPAKVPNTVIDLRSPNLRIINGPSVLSNGKQDYFPLGALQTTLTSVLAIPEDSLIHQGQGLYGLVENHSTTANGVGIWGSAKSHAHNARVWGGFLCAYSAEGESADAQLIGLEIDVENRTRPGVAPNASKVGMQIVGMGDGQVTNGIEIIGAGKGQWHNGLIFADHSIHASGSAIAMSQPTPISMGIDFSNTPFTTAAMRVSNNSLLALISKQGGDAAVYADDIGRGNLVLRSGADGLRVTNNANSENLAVLSDAGDLTLKGKLVKPADTKPSGTAIDLSQVPFAGPAIRLSNNAQLAFAAKSGADAAIYADPFNNGALVLRAARDGLRITANDDSENLLCLTSAGDLVLKGRVVAGDGSSLSAPLAPSPPALWGWFTVSKRTLALLAMFTLFNGLILVGNVRLWRRMAALAPARSGATAPKDASP